MKKRTSPYLNEIIEIMTELGGFCSYKELYKKLEERNVLNIKAAKSEANWKAIVRATIERYSSDAKIFGKKEDIFYSVNGIGGGIWGLRDYERSEISAKKDEDLKKSFNDDSILFPEGAEKERKHRIKERNAKLIKFAKNVFKEEHGGLYCEACGLNFSEKYGKWGEDYIEAHHDVNPISERTEEKGTKISDLVMLCANCHRVIHRKRPWLKVEELKQIISDNLQNTRA